MNDVARPVLRGSAHLAAGNGRLRAEAGRGRGGDGRGGGSRSRGGRGSRAGTRRSRGTGGRPRRRPRDRRARCRRPARDARTRRRWHGVVAARRDERDPDRDRDEQATGIRMPGIATTAALHAWIVAATLGGRSDGVSLPGVGGSGTLPLVRAAIDLSLGGALVITLSDGGSMTFRQKLRRQTLNGLSRRPPRSPRSPRPCGRQTQPGPRPSHARAP